MKANFLTAAIVSLIAAAPAFAGGGHAHWGYEGHHGATHWGDMEEGFKTCRLGRQQSPIDIESKAVEKADLKPIGFAYAAGTAEVVNNGHTVQVNLLAGGSANFEGGDHQLLQFHFHTPSEEKIDGKAYPLVAHFVHKNAEGKLAVVAVLFKLGRENAALKPVFGQLPAKEGESLKLESLDPAAVLPADRAYYAFMGSLTTPPCSEEVRWQVLKTPVEISPGQLAAFQKLYKMNARPVQPLHGRKVQASQ